MHLQLNPDVTVQSQTSVPSPVADDFPCFVSEHWAYTTCELLNVPSNEPPSAKVNSSRVSVSRFMPNFSLPFVKATDRWLVTSHSPQVRSVARTFFPNSACSFAFGLGPSANKTFSLQTNALNGVSLGINGCCFNWSDSSK